MAPITVAAAPQEMPVPANERGSKYSMCTIMRNDVPPPAQDERGSSYSMCAIM